MGLTENELYPLVRSWRSANPHIVDFWWQVDAAVKTAIKERIPMRTGCIRFLYQSGMLFIQLPSGTAAFLHKAPDRREPLRWGIRHL